MKKPIHKPEPEAKVEAPKTDHAAEIAALVASLSTTSPSGVETIGAKIMEHVKALKA